MKTLEPTFFVYDKQLGRVADYIGAVTPRLTTDRSAVPVFVESMMVIMVARFEHFLTSLVAGGVRERESLARAHFHRCGNDDEQRIAQSCDLKTLVRMARRRVSFKRHGKRLESIFNVLFGVSPWPDDATLCVIQDLVLLRNIFVHEGEKVLAEHAQQAHRQELFASRNYGDLTVYSVDYGAALVFSRDAIVALKNQSEHVRATLSTQFA